MKAACMDMGLEQILDKVNQELVGDGVHLPADFTFRWAGIAFSGRLEEADGYVITLRGCLGRLPFSAENAAARRTARRLLDQALIDNGSSYSLGADGTIAFETATVFAPPLSAETVLNVLAVSLLQIKPFLRRFDGLLKPVSPVQRSC